MAQVDDTRKLWMAIAAIQGDVGGGGSGGGYLVPTGCIMDYAAQGAPTGWLQCDGASLLRADYPDLFAVIGTVFGSVDATHFNVPDCRGRVTAGQDDMGGSSANRLTGLTNGVNGDTLGAAGGLESFTLATANLPAHGHGAGTLAVGTTITNGTLVNRNLSNSDFGDTGVDNGNQKNVFDAIGDSSEVTISLTSGAVTGSTANEGSGTAMPHIQPTIMMTKIIKT